jgi:predicted nuclease with TOPRIM domain
MNEPQFEKINKINISINSLKNKLKSSKGIDELTDIAGQIIELEKQIIAEKTTGYKKLEKDKKLVESKIDKIQRELKQAKEELNRLDNNLIIKVDRYKNTLQKKIEILNIEYNQILENSDTII